jgi:hypothetical protein
MFDLPLLCLGIQEEICDYKVKDINARSVVYFIRTSLEASAVIQISGQGVGVLES